MGGGHSSTLHRNLRSIFESGTCTGLSDAQLIERFLDQADAGSHLAFEALVTRHGPMVLRVCRGIVRDSHDAQDACQAVFLILARRARAIRGRDYLAGWLYRVAVRVANRQRARESREYSVRVRTEHGTSRNIADAQPAAPESHFDDSAEIVHEEVDRLDPKLREPVILCYFEGLTHDEAAERLGWPVGTVRSRMARARDRLRVRLGRRGVTGPGMGGLGVWINLDPTVPIDAASSRLIDLVANPPLPPSLISATANAATQFTTHRPLKAGVLSGSIAVISLAKGVLQAMFFEKMMTAAIVFVPVGVLAFGAGTMYGQGTKPKGAPGDAPATARQDLTEPTRATTAAPPKIANPAGANSATPAGPQALNTGADLTPEREEMLYQLLLEKAKARFRDQQAYYEEGRITIDRFLDASAQLGEAEKAVAKTPQQRIAAQRRSLQRAEDVLKREKAESVVGKGTTADVSEAELRRLQLELDLFRMEREAAGSRPEPRTEVASPKDERDEVLVKESEQKPTPEDLKLYDRYVKAAEKVFAERERLYGGGEIGVEPYIRACEELAQAELKKARSPEDRRNSQVQLFKRLTGIESSVKEQVDTGISPQSTLDFATERRLAAEIDLRTGSRPNLKGSGGDYGKLRSEYVKLKLRLDNAEAILGNLLRERSTNSTPADSNRPR